MSSRFRTIMVLALIVGFAAASIVFAQGQPSPYSGVPGWEFRQQSERPDTGVHEETSGMQEDISARVAEVNQQQQTIKLLTENGNTVELQVSEQLLTDLQRGDSVEVSIRKTEWGGVAHAAELSMAKTTSGDYRVDLDTDVRTVYVFTSVKPPAGSDTAWYQSAAQTPPPLYPSSAR